MDEIIESARQFRILVFRATNERIETYKQLEDKLFAMGWLRYTGGFEPEHALDPKELQYFHPRPGNYFISLPLDFSSMRLIHLQQIVVQTRTAFEVRELSRPIRSRNK